MIRAEIVADSVNPNGRRLTTYLLVYPRFIHAEVMTHRVLSRNAASSRAIPFRRMVEMIKQEVAMPIKWGAARAGMQSGEQLDVNTTDEVVRTWLQAARDAVRNAERLDKLGLHKSISNRLLEPFAHMTTLVSATEWANFFNLRAHAAAMPEFQELAFKMLDLYLDPETEPRELGFGEWHLPFSERVPEGASLETKLKICTARCARTSYVSFDGDHSVSKDEQLHDRLQDAGHWSPFEHCARALTPWEEERYPRSNFRGWMQYRKLFIPREDGSDVSWDELNTRRREAVRVAR